MLNKTYHIFNGIILLQAENSSYFKNTHKWVFCTHLAKWKCRPSKGSSTETR